MSLIDWAGPVTKIYTCNSCFFCENFDVFIWEGGQASPVTEIWFSTTNILLTGMKILSHEQFNPGNQDETLLTKWLCFGNPYRDQNCILFAWYVIPLQVCKLSCIRKSKRGNKATIVINDATLCGTILVLFLEYHPGQQGWNFSTWTNNSICPGNWATLVKRSQ